MTGRSVYHCEINIGFSVFFGLFQVPREMSTSLVELLLSQKLGPAMCFLTSSTLAIDSKN